MTVASPLSKRRGPREYGFVQEAVCLRQAAPRRPLRSLPPCGRGGRSGSHKRTSSSGLARTPRCLSRRTPRNVRLPHPFCAPRQLRSPFPVASCDAFCWPPAAVYERAARWRPLRSCPLSPTRACAIQRNRFTLVSFPSVCFTRYACDAGGCPPARTWVPSVGAHLPRAHYFLLVRHRCCVFSGGELSAPLCRLFTTQARPDLPLCSNLEMPHSTPPPQCPSSPTRTGTQREDGISVAATKNDFLYSRCVPARATWGGARRARHPRRSEADLGSNVLAHVGRRRTKTFYLLAAAGCCRPALGRRKAEKLCPGRRTCAVATARHLGAAGRSALTPSWRNLWAAACLSKEAGRRTMGWGARTCPVDTGTMGRLRLVATARTQAESGGGRLAVCRHEAAENAVMTEVGRGCRLETTGRGRLVEKHDQTAATGGRRRAVDHITAAAIGAGVKDGPLFSRETTCRRWMLSGHRSSAVAGACRVVVDLQNAASIRAEGKREGCCRRATTPRRRLSGTLFKPTARTDHIWKAGHLSSAPCPSASGARRRLTGEGLTAAAIRVAAREGRLRRRRICPRRLPRNGF